MESVMERASEVDAASSVCPPDCPSCNSRSGWRKPCATRIAQHNARHASAANRHIRLLTRTLELARQLAEAYQVSHPDGCGCVGCSLTHDETLQHIRFDIAGIEWTLEAAGSYLNGACSTEAGDLANGTFGESFRLLADEADAQDAVEAAERLTLGDDGQDDADDEPQPVAGTARKPR